MDYYSPELKAACIRAGFDSSGSMQQRNTNIMKVAVDLIWSEITLLFHNGVIFTPGRDAKELFGEWNVIQEDNINKYEALLTEDNKTALSKECVILQYWLYDVINEIKYYRLPNRYRLNECWDKLISYHMKHEKLHVEWKALSRLADLIYAMNVDS